LVRQFPDPETGLGQDKVDRKRPPVASLQERQFGPGVEHEDGLPILDPEPVRAQPGERVPGVRGQVATLAGESVQRAAALQDVPDALVPEPSAGGVRVAVRGHLDRPQVGRERIRLQLVGHPGRGMRVGERLQVSRGRPVPADRGQGGPEDVLVVVEKPGPEIRYRDRVEGQQGRGAAGQLGVDLGRDLLGLVAIDRDLLADRFTRFAVVNPPSAVVQVQRHLPDPGPVHTGGPPSSCGHGRTLLCTQRAPSVHQECSIWDWNWL
jgi:hypothetical protein